MTEAESNSGQVDHQQLDLATRQHFQSSQLVHRGTISGVQFPAVQFGLSSDHLDPGGSSRIEEVTHTASCFDLGGVDEHVLAQGQRFLPSIG